MRSSLETTFGRIYQGIPDYRSQFIDLKLRQFIKENNISWPVDSVRLLAEMKREGRYGIKALAIANGLTDGLDASAHYDKRSGHYAVIINRKKFSYPFKQSSDRRLNFTIAHEIGHIVLEHIKFSSPSYTDELEADEFAARLLMPEKLLLTFNYYSISQVAAWLKVSKSALINRLIRLNKLDLLKDPKVRSCVCCGNIRFSPFALHCGVCGHKLARGVKGIRRIYYPDFIQMDSCKRSLVCIKCRNDIKSITGQYCPYCRTSIFNLCSDESCSYANPAYAMRCEMCGRLTIYQKEFFHSTCDGNHGHPSLNMVECRH